MFCSRRGYALALDELGRSSAKNWLLQNELWHPLVACVRRIGRRCSWRLVIRREMMPWHLNENPQLPRRRHLTYFIAVLHASISTFSPHVSVMRDMSTRYGSWRCESDYIARQEWHENCRLVS
jgi:hypothetical protein